MNWIGMLRSLGAVLAGYAVIVLGTILTFETLLGGVTYTHSPPSELVIATIGACITGLLGGITAASLAAHRPFLHAAFVLVPLAIDSVIVFASDDLIDPLWFDITGSLTLMITALLGGYFVQRRQTAASTA